MAYAPVAGGLRSALLIPEEAVIAPAAIVMSGVTRTFGGTVAVGELSLEVSSGEVFGLLGHNGAGKTTTIRLLTGLLLPNTGTITVFGRSPCTDGAAIRARSGVLSEVPGLDERLTAWENLAFFAELFSLPPRQIPARVTFLLEQFGLSERAGERVARFSKGMKQRLALARCLLHDPDLLFLDEPTAGLDPVAAREVRELIRGLRGSGRTVFLCTHNLDEAQRLCDRVAVLRRGRLVALGTPVELARQLGYCQRLELEVDPARIVTAAAVLARYVPSGQVVVGEGGLLTAAGVERQEVPRLVEALVRKEIPVYRVTPRDASLEEIYLGLYGEEERA